MSRSHSLRRILIGVVVVVVVAGAVVAVIATRKDATPAAAASIFKTATVQQGALSTNVSLDGTVVLSDVTTVLHRAASTTSSAGRSGPGARSAASPSSSSSAQTVTSVISLGAQVTAGSILYSVNSAPVVALQGALPAWRTLSTASSDGADIRQLETALAWLGYDPKATMTIDDHFDSRTAAVVRAWQQGYGLPVTGKVTLGEVVFIPTDTVVAEVDVAVGASVADGDQVLALTGAAQQVVIQVPSANQALFVPGLQVKIAGNPGTVELLRSAQSSGAVVVEAVINPAAPLQGASNGSTVKVSATLVQQANALIVPSESLVSRIDGTYAVQVVQPDGSNRFVTVQVLAVAGLDAAISGDGIAAGDEVLQPV